MAEGEAGLDALRLCRPLPVTVASLTEFTERGLSRYIASKVIVARNSFISAASEGGASLEEVWSTVASWEDFWEALKGAGLCGVGTGKVSKLKAAGAYFGNRNINSLDAKELAKVLAGCEAAAQVEELLSDPEQPEGVSSIEEILDTISDSIGTPLWLPLACLVCSCRWHRPSDELPSIKRIEGFS